MSKKTVIPQCILFFILFTLTGCSSIGNKTASMSIIYATTAVLALLLLIGYCTFVSKKDIWYLLLFSSIFIVNTGYFSLAISKTLEEALLANRISYLGSVFLPITMLMLILNVAKIRYKKWIPGLLITLGAAVFFVAASPGYSTIYYKEVSIEFTNGVTRLNKTYGPWHSLYLYYLLSTFSAMVMITIYTILKQKMATKLQSLILAGAVFVNLIVWLFEQLVHIEFEILSISYIISELFLLTLQILILETEKNEQQAPANIPAPEPMPTVMEPISLVPAVPTEPEPAEKPMPIFEPELDKGLLLQEQLKQFSSGLLNLTPTERMIYDFYIEGKTTKEIMAELNIKENTLKFHNKNLYGKLGVSSRKELKERYKQLDQNE